MNETGPVSQLAAGRTVRVHLADAPTDVLVWLVEQPSHLWWRVGQIAAATAPDGADDAETTVVNALSLLREMGYVVRSREAHGWAATVDGQRAVTDALAAASDGRSDERN